MSVFLHLPIGTDNFIISFCSFLNYLNFVFYVPEDGHMVDRNLQNFTVYIN